MLVRAPEELPAEAERGETKPAAPAARLSALSDRGQSATSPRWSTFQPGISWKHMDVRANASLKALIGADAEALETDLTTVPSLRLPADR